MVPWGVARGHGGEHGGSGEPSCSPSPWGSWPCPTTTTTSTATQSGTGGAGGDTIGAVNETGVATTGGNETAV